MAGILFIVSCGNDTPEPKEFVCGDTITDIDGNVYNTVSIGGQCWMKENLKTTKYRNGESIGTTSTATLDISSETTPKYQWAYEGNESNVATYGRLYTWFAITDSRNVCPDGWHIPTDAEWTALTDTLGGISVAGGKLKSTTNWTTPNTGATNASGFSAFANGWRSNAGIFEDKDLFGHWWSATENTANAPFLRVLYYDFDGVTRASYFGSKDAISVRCVKD